MHDPHCHNDPNHTDHSAHPFCASHHQKLLTFHWQWKVRGIISFYHRHLHGLLTSRWKPTLQEDIATAETRLGRWLKYLSPVKWGGYDRGQKWEGEPYWESWPRPSSWLHHEQATGQGWASNTSKSAASGIAYLYFLTSGISKSEMCQAEVQVFLGSVQGCF